MTKNKIFVACDSTNISKVEKIISKTQNSKIKVGYKFGLEFLNSKNGRLFISKLNNKTIITNVFKRAEKAGLGTVYVATEDEEIYEEVKKNGGNCVMTEKGHRSGSDRIFDAILNLKLDNVKYVINLQGDEPLINPEDIKKLNSFVSLNNLDLGTLAAIINSDDKLNNNNIVKVKTLK